MDKTIRPVICIMADLPIVTDSRDEAIKIIQDNYDYIKQKKDLFTREGLSNGIGFQPDLKSLRHLPMNTLVSEDGLIREAKKDEFNLKTLTGIWALYLYMSKVSINKTLPTIFLRILMRFNPTFFFCVFTHVFLPR